ncbi:MAG: DUF1501 domain-containing protein [Gemmataceae bacterium]
MLTILNHVPAGFRPSLDRRGFLRIGSLGLGGLTLPNLLAASERSGGRRNDTAVILFWMGGGPSQLDTWDPKPNAPDIVRGPFSSIPTRTPGIRVCELLPKQAAQSDRFALVRSFTHHEYNHPDASHLVQTGYHEPNVQFRGQIYPAQGSIVSKLRGANRLGMPPYVCIPDAYFARQGFFQLATYLGKEFDPANAGSEPTTVPRPHAFVRWAEDFDRSHDRRELLRRIDAARRSADRNREDGGRIVERMSW